MSAEIINLQTMTTLDLQPERVLRAAADNGLASAVVIGFTPEGEIYFASSVLAAPEILWLLELACDRFMKNGKLS